MSGRGPDYNFGKSRRLLTSAEYSRVFDRTEAKASHRNLLLLASRNQGPDHRLGLVIAKKNVRLAAQRNRIKRLAREFFRQQAQEAPTLDVVLLARRGIDRLDNADLSSILQQQWQKLTRHASNLDRDTGREN